MEKPVLRTGFFFFLTLGLFLDFLFPLDTQIGINL